MLKLEFGTWQFRKNSALGISSRYFTIFSRSACFDFRAALCQNSSFRTWRFGLVSVFTAIRGFSFSAL